MAAPSLGSKRAATVLRGGLMASIAEAVCCALDALGGLAAWVEDEGHPARALALMALLALVVSTCDSWW